MARCNKNLEKEAGCLVKMNYTLYIENHFAVERITKLLIYYYYYIYIIKIIREYLKKYPLFFTSNKVILMWSPTPFTKYIVAMGIMKRYRVVLCPFVEESLSHLRAVISITKVVNQSCIQTVHMCDLFQKTLHLSNEIKMRAFLFFLFLENWV